VIAVDFFPDVELVVRQHKSTVKTLRFKKLTTNLRNKRGGYLLIKKSFHFIELNLNRFLINVGQFEDG
jgi:hypothetical protein